MGGICPGGMRGKNKGLRGKTDSEFSTRVESLRGLPLQKRVLIHRPTWLALKSGSIVLNLNSSRLSFSSELKQSTPATEAANKVPQGSSFLGRAGIVGLERTVDLLDMLGSSMSDLNAGHSFPSGIISRGNWISILAFEVANTIAGGANLLQSLSEENILFLKKDVLNSEGVQKLVSTDIKELLSVAATDKREELNAFSREVIRFGDLCKDPQWHNLGRYFSKLDMNNSINKHRAEAETTMQELITLAQQTSELYHELNALDRFEQDYRQKLEEVSSLNLPRRGESLMILHDALKQQTKLVKSLKKKSLWFRTLEEVYNYEPIVEKLVHIVTFMHQVIFEAFGGVASVQKASTEDPQRLGVAGLTLHYANVINQIDNIASQPAFVPANVRETLYHGLPTNVKKSLRSRLLSIDAKEKLTISEVKDEMEKTFHWLVPVAANTTSISEIMGDESWQSNIDNSEGVLVPSNVRKLKSPQPLKLLPASTDDSSRKHILGASTSYNREHRKVQLVEQPGQKTTVKNSQETRTATINQGHPMSADDIQKAKMHAQYMQSKYRKTGSSSNETNEVKIETLNKSSSTLTSTSPLSLSHGLPKPEEPKRPLMLSITTYNRMETLDQNQKMDSQETPLEKSKISNTMVTLDQNLKSQKFRTSNRVETLDQIQKMDSREASWEKYMKVQIPWQTPPGTIALSVSLLVPLAVCR
ncbi:hypothetical protein SLE2022_098580 [Rubroshorea leprosula]